MVHREKCTLQLDMAAIPTMSCGGTGTAGHGRDPDNVFRWHFRKDFAIMLESPMNFVNWKMDQPSSENAQSCMAMSGTNYRWEVFECGNYPLCGICEIDP